MSPQPVPDLQAVKTGIAEESLLPSVSVVIPVFNEVQSLPLLVEAIHRSLAQTGIFYEIVVIDDGSTDGSGTLVQQLAGQDPQLKGILLRRNYGQTAAIAAGFDYAKGSIIVTMDGDLQNDPADIPRLLERLNQGYDLVSGWRKHRQDDLLTRLLPSVIANWLIGAITGVKLHDYGCGLKVYRTEVIQDMNLYGELHRFLPALAFMEGARITEIPITHSPRQFGRSKYGLGRTIHVVMDLLTVYFMKRLLTKPMHIFGSFGMVTMAAGIAIGGYLTLVKLIDNQDIGDRPLLILAVVLFLTGIQLFSFGLLAELLMRTYHESQKRPIYRVRQVIQ
jgi:glycosyltransferase involved in cell wall biosynthesis